MGVKMCPVVPPSVFACWWRRMPGKGKGASDEHTAFQQKRHSSYVPPQTVEPRVTLSPMVFGRACGGRVETDFLGALKELSCLTQRPTFDKYGKLSLA